MEQRFKGFEEEAFGFFLMIRLNNNKPFFDQNRELYERVLKDPMWNLAQDLEETMHQIDPNIETRPSKCVSRLRRSSRYRKNLLPYRDYLWVSWRDRSMDQEESHGFGFYFEVGFEEMSCGAGAWGDRPRKAKLLRKRIEANPAGFERIVRDVAAAGFLLGGEDYVRLDVPPFLPALAQVYYRKKSFYLEKPLPMDDYHTGPALVSVLKEAYEALAPLYRFVNEAYQAGDE